MAHGTAAAIAKAMTNAKLNRLARYLQSRIDRAADDGERRVYDDALNIVMDAKSGDAPSLKAAEGFEADILSGSTREELESA